MKKLRVSAKQKAAISLMQQKENELKEALRNLLTAHNGSDMFKALTEVVCEESGPEYLDEETITHITDRGYTVVKIDGLNRQMQFEDNMREIMPHSNERQANLFTPYLNAVA